MKVFHGTNTEKFIPRNGLFTAPDIKTAELYARDSIGLLFDSGKAFVYGITLQGKMRIGDVESIIPFFPEYSILRKEPDMAYTILDEAKVKKMLKKIFDIIIFKDHAPNSTRTKPIYHTSWLILNKNFISNVELESEVNEGLSFVTLTYQLT